MLAMFMVTVFEKHSGQVLDPDIVRLFGVIPLVPGSTGPGVRESRGPRVPGPRVLASASPGVRESRVRESRGVYLAPFLTYNLLINFRKSRSHVVVT